MTLVAPDRSLVAAVTSADLDADPIAEAKRVCGRKVARFLDPMSVHAFLAAWHAYRRSAGVPADRVALYTVSGWDPDMPDQPFTVDGEPAGVAELSRHILEQANPLDWLRMLCNNALCQVSIAEGFRGPNAHIVAGAEGVRQALIMAAVDLAAGRADLALVIAYDPAAGAEHDPPPRATGRAAGMALPADPACQDLLRRLVPVADSAAAAGEGALAAMHACLDALPEADRAVRGPERGGG